MQVVFDDLTGRVTKTLEVISVDFVIEYLVSFKKIVKCFLW